MFLSADVEGGGSHDKLGGGAGARLGNPTTQNFMQCAFTPFLPV